MTGKPQRGKKKSSRRPAEPTEESRDEARRIEGVAARLEAACEALERAAAEAPKATDFEPLAEHLYSFAVSAPRLLEGLQGVPRAADTIQASLISLREVAETLHFSNDRLADSLLKIPRAEDYEPLAAPLREFARVAPALAEALAEVLRVARPLADSVRTLPNAERPRGSGLARGGKPPGPPAPVLEITERALSALAAAGEQMLAAREAITAALASLPRDPEYARFASQLRELAAVSPSLFEWLAQVPRLTVPLEASVDSLRAAADGLAEGRERALKVLRDLGGEVD